MKIGWLVLLTAFTLEAADNWRDQGIIYLDHTPHAVMHPVPVRAVTLQEGFWADRRKINVERSIPTMLELLEVHGTMDNFRRLTGKKDAPRRGPIYTDSDIYGSSEEIVGGVRLRQLAK
jgi:hypothetical protein